MFISMTFAQIAWVSLFMGSAYGEGGITNTSQLHQEFLDLYEDEKKLRNIWWQIHTDGGVDVFNVLGNIK